MAQFPISMVSGAVPSEIPYGRASAAAYAAPSIAVGNMGETLGSISDQMVKGIHDQNTLAEKENRRRLQEQAEMESVSLTSDYDNRINILKQEVLKSPDPLNHVALFTKLSQEALNDVAGTSNNSVAKRVLTQHGLRLLPGQLDAVRKDAMTLFDQSQLAHLDRLGEEQSTKAVGAATETDRIEAEALYLGMVNRAEQRRLLNPVQAEKRRQVFAETIQVKTMRTLARTNPAELDKRTLNGDFPLVDAEMTSRILEEARKKVEHQDNLNDKAFKVAKEAMHRNYTSLAIQKKLTDADLYEMKMNRNPYVTPDEALHLEKMQYGKETKEGDDIAASIMQEYELQKESFATINKAREKLNAAARDLPGPSKAIQTAAAHLNARANAMRSTNAAELAAGIKSAEDELALTTRPVLPGIMGPIQKAKTAKDKAELRGLLRKGVPKDDAVKTIIKKRELEEKAIPPRHKETQDLAE